MKKMVYKCHRAVLGTTTSGRICLKCFSNLNVHKNHLEILLKIDSGSGGQGWDLRFCISNKLPGDHAWAIGEPHFE